MPGELPVCRKPADLVAPAGGIGTFVRV